MQDYRRPYAERAQRELLRELERYQNDVDEMFTGSTVGEIPFEDRIQHIYCGTIFEKEGLFKWISDDHRHECPVCDIGDEFGFRRQMALMENLPLDLDLGEDENEGEVRVKILDQFFSLALRKNYSLLAYQLSQLQVIRDSIDRYHYGSQPWLHQVSFFATPLTMLVIIAAGADVNILSTTADTAHLTALRRGNVETALLLLNYGAVDRPDFWQGRCLTDHAESMQDRANNISFSLTQSKQRYSRKRSEYDDYSRDKVEWRQRNPNKKHTPYEPRNDLRVEHRILAPDQTPMPPAQIRRLFGLTTRQLRGTPRIECSPVVSANLQHGTSREIMLHHVCGAADPDAVRREIDKRANVHAVNSSGVTPLMFLVRAEWMTFHFSRTPDNIKRIRSVIELLFNRGGALIFTQRDNYGLNSMDHCLECTSYATFRCLLELGADPVASGVFKRSSMNRRVGFRTFRYAIQLYIDYQKARNPQYNDSVLHVAIRILDEELPVISKIILCEINNRYTGEYYVDSRSDILAKNQDGLTPRDLAAQLGKQPIVDLIDLIVTIERNDIVAIGELILVRGINVLVRNSRGEYPLEIANRLGHVAIAETLRSETMRQMHGEYNSMVHYVRSCVLRERIYHYQRQYGESCELKKQIDTVRRLGFVDEPTMRIIENPEEFYRDPFIYDYTDDMPNDAALAKELEAIRKDFLDEYQQMVLDGNDLEQVITHFRQKRYEISSDQGLAAMDTSESSDDNEEQEEQEHSVVTYVREHHPGEYEYALREIQDEEQIVDHLLGRFPNFRYGM